jgi:hypothetical protein
MLLAARQRFFAAFVASKLDDRSDGDWRPIDVCFAGGMAVPAVCCYALRSSSLPYSSFVI